MANKPDRHGLNIQNALKICCEAQKYAFPFPVFFWQNARCCFYERTGWKILTGSRVKWSYAPSENLAQEFNALIFELN
ncbi:hypothetical protein [Undibacterium oligocarboniphilum]|uniref:Uncharacterized protein n=1 Tax=Undibacterium oligocarboniphilum TaxID=666702 RepID=A0A850QR91_9BURK|nr:hypothetical protein [Undibacterium oligocarboniphilum]MBC3871396.1 hypothetical protein [Undibacterium oligocarboniphilum]NVO78894.1 hypothetical protein [Undibacterium oligocarboniphilum]